MKLPHAERCVFGEEKIRRYLLDPAHPVGGSKAKLFLQLGFNPGNWSVLASALTTHGATHEVSSVRKTPFGTIYVVTGVLDAPSGAASDICTVWHLDTGALVPRLVTAYPSQA